MQSSKAVLENTVWQLRPDDGTYETKNKDLVHQKESTHRDVQVVLKISSHVFGGWVGFPMNSY